MEDAARCNRHRRSFCSATFITYYEFFRTLPPPYFSSDEEHFLYGSIGTEGTAGVPYWIWLVLPRIFPDKLPSPGGYETLGIVAQEGRELPIGFSKQTIGIERVGINCAFCHTATYRLHPGDKPVIVPAAPSHTTSPQDYLRFLFACAADPRFNSATIMAEIAKNYHLSLLDSLTYRFVLIPFTKITLLRQQNEYQQYGWMKNNPPWGYGRIDPFNPVKYRVLNQPVDGSIGNSDMVPLWNLGAHRGFSYHWDGLNTSLQEVVISSAIGDGTPPEWVDKDWKQSDTQSSLKRVMNYISRVQPPKFPFAVDAASGRQGQDPLSTAMRANVMPSAALAPVKSSPLITPCCRPTVTASTCGRRIPPRLTTTTARDTTGVLLTSSSRMAM